MRQSPVIFQPKTLAVPRYWDVKPRASQPIRPSASAVTSARPNLASDRLHLAQGFSEIGWGEDGAVSDVRGLGALPQGSTGSG